MADRTASAEDGLVARSTDRHQEDLQPPELPVVQRPCPLAELRLLRALEAQREARSRARRGAGRRDFHQRKGDWWTVVELNRELTVGQPLEVVDGQVGHG